MSVTRADLRVETARNPQHAILQSQRSVNDAWRGECRSSHKHEDWGAVYTFEEALARADEGYVEATQRMKDGFEAAKKYVYERIGPRNVRPENSYVGSTPNVSRAILGLPKDMRRTVREARKLPGVHIYYDVGFNCRYTDDEIITPGCRMLALVSACLRQGIPVKLSITTHTRGLCRGGGVFTWHVSVKDYSDHTNIRKVAYWLAHPSVLRRLYFGVVESSPLVDMYDCGYGFPITNSKSDCEELKRIYREDGIFFFTMHDFKEDEDILRAWDRLTS